MQLIYVFSLKFQLMKPVLSICSAGPPSRFLKKVCVRTAIHLSGHLRIFSRVYMVSVVYKTFIA